MWQMPVPSLPTDATDALTGTTTVEKSQTDELEKNCELAFTWIDEQFTAWKGNTETQENHNHSVETASSVLPPDSTKRITIGNRGSQAVGLFAVAVGVAGLTLANPVKNIACSALL